MPAAWQAKVRLMRFGPGSWTARPSAGLRPAAFEPTRFLCAGSQSVPPAADRGPAVPRDDDASRPGVNPARPAPLHPPRFVAAQAAARTDENPRAPTFEAARQSRVRTRLSEPSPPDSTLAAKASC